MPPLEPLYDDHATALHALALDLTRDETEAADVVRDVFCRLAEHPHLFREVRDERAFLLRQIYTRVTDVTRRATHRTGAAAAPGLFADDDPSARAFSDALTRSLAELSVNERSVIHLRIWHGLTFEDIAVAMRLPVNAVRRHHDAGWKKLLARPDLRTSGPPLESRMAAVPHREAPPELRPRVLAAAEAARRPTPRERLRRALWPHPLAWVALALAWVVAAALWFAGPSLPSLLAVTPPENLRPAVPAEGRPARP